MIDEEREFRPGQQGKGHLVYEEVNVFSLGQRLGRLRYVCYLFTGALILGLFVALMAILAQAVPAWASRLMFGFVILLGLAFFIWSIGLMVRRLHDAGRPGWWAIGILVPGLNVLLTLYLLVAAPDDGVNRFGTPNPPNSLVVNIVGGFLWGLQVIGILLNLLLLMVVLTRPEWLAHWQSQYMPAEMQEQMRKLERMQRQAQ